VAVKASPSLVRIDEDGEPLLGGEPDASLIDYAEAMLVVSLAQCEGLQGLPENISPLQICRDGPIASACAAHR